MFDMNKYEELQKNLRASILRANNYSSCILTMHDLKQFLEYHHSRILATIGMFRIDYKVPRFLGRLRAKKTIKKLKDRLSVGILLQQNGYLKRKENRGKNRITITKIQPEYLDCRK